MPTPIEFPIPDDAKIMPSLFALMELLDSRERIIALQQLAERYMPDGTQICAWCFTAYPTIDAAARCARDCRDKAQLVADSETGTLTCHKVVSREIKVCNLQTGHDGGCTPDRPEMLSDRLGYPPEVGDEGWARARRNRTE